MGISIIICTFNNSKSLKRCLTSLVAVKDENVDYEIIIIDNNSNDDTRTVVDHMIQKNNKIKYHFFPNQGLSKSRNQGIKVSSKEYLVFTDDDITFDKFFLTSYNRLIKTKMPGLAGGRIKLKYSTSRPIWLSDKIDYIYGWYDIGKKNRYYPPSIYPLGPSFLIKRKLVEKLGNFNISLGLSGTEQTIVRGEETELAIRYTKKGIKPIYCGESLVYHNVDNSRMNKKWFKERYIQSGKVASKTNKNHHIIIYLKYLASSIGIKIYKEGTSEQFYHVCKNLYFKEIIKHNEI